ncbi:MAG: XRE family transcriptional regulator [Zetaproteobacteria bacterium]|nr:MAG: XRE family transcriptional regulator [Zetaproteobacteria bacterium]
MTTDKRFVTRLKQPRVNQGITQDALAEKARISRTHLARLEFRQQDPTLGTLRKLANALKVNVGELVE